MFGEESYLGNFRDAIPFLETGKFGQGRARKELNQQTPTRHPLRHRRRSLQRWQAETMKEYNRLLDEQEEQRAHELAARMERILGKSKQNRGRQEVTF